MKSFGLKMKNILIYSVVILAVCCFGVSMVVCNNSSIALAESGTIIKYYEGLEITNGYFPLTDATPWWNAAVISKDGDRTWVFDQDYSNKSNLSITIKGRTTTETIRLDLNGHTIKCTGYQPIKISHPNILITNECNTAAYGEFTITEDTVVSLKGGANTTCKFIIEANSTADAPVLVYSGKLTRMGRSGTGIVLAKALPKGYKMIAHLADGTQKAMPYKTAEAIDNFIGYVEDDHPDWYVQYEGQYIVAVSTKICNHDSLTDNVCDYCNETMDSGKVLEATRRELEDAKKEYLDLLGTKVDKQVLDQAMHSLNESLRLANEAIRNNKDATDEEIKNLKQAIEDAKADAINTANEALESAKTELNDAISTKADTSYVDDKVKELNNAITNAISTANTYADDKDTALKTELETAIATAKAEAIQTASAALESAKTELNNAISAKADTTYVDEKVEELNTAIANATATANAYADEKDTALKNELETAIATAKADAIQTASEALESAKTELNDAISAKANTSDVEKKVGELNKAIANAISTAKAYADEKDTALKNELEKAIATAKAEAIKTASEALESAKTELNDAISAKADTTYVDEKVEELNKAIANAISTANAYTDEKDAALKTELETAIATAKAEAIKTASDTAKAEAIQTASEELEKAKAELLEAINKRTDVTTIETKINDLNTSLTNLETTTKAYNDDQSATLKAELEQSILSAKTVLQNAIDELANRLDSAENRIDETENNIDTIKIFMYVMSGLVAVLGILVIILSVALKKVAKLMTKGTKEE